ncbi:amino acid/polyamine/organocation transporter (APC superfamily) [Salana multivorans]|uniref:Amino acid/polyamine/organocation transporter (APC superfamily) n=1 Tax=Salana multivorans TaxID=120377 RepID=A0A3N2D1N1_9MICO|nr:APC family permease [Salana multivorans]MBN8881343.1 APC family permease [Salana multivorans]OJX94439.1 MAG: DNA-binding protein [Micrococcales bacterium 73-15]ROR93663.1 amino acid/polyamine/organocation transporter (APC superfamily) [Salana multivorans]
MPALLDGAKRLLVGRPVASDRLGHTLLPKRIALPVFASDALSSVAYAPDEILLTLSIAGITSYVLSPWIGAAVVVVLLTVVASYRQTVHAYPSGGGDYEVATTNLGPSAGVGVASALLVDYVLTVAVSISTASQYLAAVLPVFDGHERTVAVAAIVLLTLVNLRGVRESGRALAIPVYCFMGAMGLLAVVGTLQALTGNLHLAESAGFELVAEPGFEQGLVGLGGAMLMARAFSSGCAALTGVEAISNGVPAFRRPKSRNAATTLLLLGLVSAAMIVSILYLANRTGVLYAENPHEQMTLDGQPLPVDYTQNPVIGQIAAAVFHDFRPMFYLVTAVTGLILVLAANTAFNGFPVLGSILARDGLLPRQLHTRGDRLAFSNGIITLAVAAIALVWIFDAQVTRLIQLYIVGVFISFTMSQLGMVRHWTRELRTVVEAPVRRRMERSRAVNAFGFGLTSLVLLIVLLTKFTRGAWITLLLMAVLFVMMRAISRHYEQVSEELALDDPAAARSLPSRVKAVVLVSRVHKPTMRAIAYARATRPSSLEAITVGVDPGDVEELRRDWAALDIPVPLTVLDSPYREITRPVLEYVKSLRTSSPRDLVVVYVPEYVVGHWWEQLLHNQSALRLKSRLLFTPGVVVASVPWQLDSAERAGDGSHWDEPALPWKPGA